MIEHLFLTYSYDDILDFEEHEVLAAAHVTDELLETQFNEAFETYKQHGFETAEALKNALVGNVAGAVHSHVVGRSMGRGSEFDGNLRDTIMSGASVIAYNFYNQNRRDREEDDNGIAVTVHKDGCRVGFVSFKPTQTVQ